MRSFYLLFVLLSGLGYPAAAQATKPRSGALFPIVEQGRWGFIDSAGRVVIQPHFAQVQPFSEGLAPALEGGYYGFIDTQGKWVLPPAYEYVSPFRLGVAVATQAAMPCLVSRTGGVVPASSQYGGMQWLASASASHCGLWAGWRTAAGKPRREPQAQLLDTNGHLLRTDTFLTVSELRDNRVVVRQHSTMPLPKKQSARVPQTGVLDGRGRWVVPYQRFNNVSAFQDGVALAELATADTTAPARQVIIDTTGRLLAQLPANQRALLFNPYDRKWTVEPPDQWEERAYARYDRPVFSDGVARVRIGRAGQAPVSDSCELGIIDRQGRLVVRFPGFDYISPFRHGRAWGRTADEEWYLIDKAGHRLSRAFDEILTKDEGPAFAGGAEVVILTEGEVVAAVDRTGKLVRQLKANISEEDARQVGDILAFRTADTTESQGFWNWRTGLLVPPRYTELAAGGYQHGLLAVVENHRLGYLAPDGHYVWRASPPTSVPLNLDYMRRSFYQVASAVRLPRYASLGGWAGSGNRPTRAASALLPANKLTLHVTASAVSNGFGPRIDGYRVALANTTADTIVFDAQDSSLYLTVQAQDAHGQWRDIEYTPSSWCGNSYHQVYLAPGQGWQLVVPTYAGGLQTQLRLCLIRRKANDPQQSVILYSNSFSGGINAAQFWRQEGHVAHDIMDSYSN